MRFTLANAMNWCAVAVLVAAVAMWIGRQPTSGASARSPAPSELSELAIDFEKAPLTLVLVLQQGCEFCEESLPFYRRIIQARERSGAEVRIIVVAPSRDANIAAYLADREFVPDDVVLVDAGDIPVPTTPTLLLADRAGTVTRTWYGLLDQSEERDLVARITAGPSLITSTFTTAC